MKFLNLLSLTKNYLYFNDNDDNNLSVEENLDYYIQINHEIRASFSLKIGYKNIRRYLIFAFIKV